ncbi:DUF4180 domain-containing protein [Phyllobacterium myrsinacearum]|uniref:DUF4180 domain-containing protein n=1 Tax=Phyllobacterium myrsinacearum TaxID=28101 RepID=A0A2S9J9Q6_9HYPH|nr:DUF4180 domain-containing protein [Phyllobacterium myrsinacearum]PRD49479.1 DUF4180 domain-containing protein [Phyllobacterium myrsinacearum]PWV83369.1 uncharacterized protein DUF4180 [Phyllobacterium myrsinacearum]RZU96744.1 uncharacterized protein DUF4180 [Phyllobacterium myrsinacearum]
MSDEIIEMHGVRVLLFAGDGEKLAAAQDANTFLSETWARDATLAVIPVSRLGGDFLDLKTRIAGEVIQKFVNYQVRLAILGDISAWTDTSKPLRDFVYETNRGRSLWFIRDLAELDQRLAANAAG